jgi:hypothetical protein
MGWLVAVALVVMIEDDNTASSNNAASPDIEMVNAASCPDIDAPSEPITTTAAATTSTHDVVMADTT